MRWMRRLALLAALFGIGVAAAMALSPSAGTGATTTGGRKPAPLPPITANPPGPAVSDTTTTTATTVTAARTTTATTRAGTTTRTLTTPGAKTTVLKIGQSAAVQCGTPGTEAVLRLANDTGVVPFATIDVGRSATLQLLATAGTGAELRWKFERAVVAGWPVPNASDFGTLTIKGCTATYTAPRSTGSNTPRMFVTFWISHVAFEGGCKPSATTAGEGGPCIVPSPLHPVIAIRGGSTGTTPPKPCGYGTISVHVSVGGATRIWIDGRFVGTSLVVRRVTVGYHRVTLQFPDGSVRTYSGYVRDCSSWPITIYRG